MKTDGYVHLLIGEYVARKSSNPTYSERAFARSLGLSAGFLKLVFQGKKNLSLDRAKTISDMLEWNGAKKNKFLKKVKESSLRTEAKAKDKKLLQKDDFFEVSDWYNFAILEFIKNKNGKVTPQQLGAAFNLSTTEVNFSLKNMIKLNLLELASDNTYEVPKHYEMPSISSAGIRRYHRQSLQKAANSLDEQSFDQRDFRGLTLSFERKKLDEAKKFLQKFVAEFDKRFGATPGDSVYQLTTSLFRLDTETK